MQIYLSSHETELIATLQHALLQAQLQEAVHCEILAAPAQDTQKLFDPETLNLTTVLVTLLGVGGAGTVFISKLARVLETLINSKQVEAKIKHKDTLIEISGSAGHIEQILKTLVESKQD